MCNLKNETNEHTHKNINTDLLIQKTKWGCQMGGSEGKGKWMKGGGRFRLPVNGMNKSWN